MLCSALHDKSDLSASLSDFLQRLGAVSKLNGKHRVALKNTKTICVCEQQAVRNKREAASFAAAYSLIEPLSETIEMSGQGQSDEAHSLQVARDTSSLVVSRRKYETRFCLEVHRK